MVESMHPEMTAQDAPDRIALRMADSDEVLRYGELAADANRIARVLAALGLAAGDAIACLLPNGPDLWRVVWAAKNSGLRYVLIGTRQNAADIGFIARDCGAKALVAAAVFAPLVREAGLLGGDIRLLLSDGAGPGFDDLRTLSAGQPPTPLADRRRGASMLYSSGTTGRPKGVKVALADVPPETPPPRQALLQRNYALGPDTVFLTAAPFYHAGPLRIAMAVHRAGGTVIALRKFDAEAVLAAIERHKVSHAFFVPTMFQRLLDLPPDVRQRCDTSSLRHAIHGAAPCPPHVKHAMIAWWGPVIDELYGGTESIGQTFISSEEWLRHPGSVGRPSGHVEAKIVDDAGNRLPPGSVGLVMMRNPQRFEYHGAAAGDALQIYDAEGFASLGDIGYLDAKGYLYLTDRAGNMIISGGVNIYPQEAEAMLMGHPAVADVAVIGVPDRDLGEVAKALVVPAPDIAPSAETASAILAWCLERLSRYKCPRSLDFVISLPRNELGKLVKRDIAAELRERPGRF
ncbi:MAG: AMP-dependent synthetase and ligase [Pseudomonadota bacterium]|jgi:acyl-CoA synthetase (AMP-forming)/AMP-acid ligase II